MTVMINSLWNEQVRGWMVEKKGAFHMSLCLLTILNDVWAVLNIRKIKATGKLTFGDLDEDIYYSCFHSKPKIIQRKDNVFSV